MSESMSKKYPFPQKKKDDGTPPDVRSFELLSEWRDGLEENKGDRAALRRASSLAEVMFVPSFHILINKLRNENYAIPDKTLPKLAAIAGLAARLKKDVQGTLGEQLGTPNASEKPLLSELRMRRILACDDLEELYTLLRRALSIIDDAASLSDLALTVWHWMPLDEKRPFDYRRRLAFDYYAAAPISPNS